MSYEYSEVKRIFYQILLTNKNILFIILENFLFKKTNIIYKIIFINYILFFKKKDNNSFVKYF